MTKVCVKGKSVFYPRNYGYREMERSLGEHITELERRIHHISQEIMQNQKTLTERNHLESELRVAQQALEHFLSAVKLERQLRRT